MSATTTTFPRQLITALLNQTQSDPTRVVAGVALIQTIATLDFIVLNSVIRDLASGLERLDMSKRIMPANYSDFVFTDAAMIQLADVFTALGFRLETLARHCNTPEEQAEVAAFQRLHGLDDLLLDLTKENTDHNFDQLVAFIKQLAENSGRIKLAGSNQSTGQYALLDIPMFILSRFCLVAGHQLKELAAYSLPLDY
ncbi:hypothetical protein KKE28_00085 [Patescibacteria group bacterium]|nr:hypothetical protein [Patescibacteria group bacterium]